MGLGQVSRPWLTPKLHLAPGSRGGGQVSGPQHLSTAGPELGLVSFASLNSVFERVKRTDGVGQFPRWRTECRSPASDWCSAACASGAHLDFLYNYFEPAADMS